MILTYQKALVEYLGISSTVINIKGAYDGVIAELEKQFEEISSQTITNLPSRLRMATLYAVSQTVNGRVANTCNLSEDYVGYNTIFGDDAGDFSPLRNLTVQEVKAVGRALNLPSMFVDKIPIDGLQGKTDEDNLGFTYEELDRYIREGICEDAEIRENIDRRHKANLFKLQPMPVLNMNLKKNRRIDDFMAEITKAMICRINELAAKKREEGLRQRNSWSRKSFIRSIWLRSEVRCSALLATSDLLRT